MLADNTGKCICWAEGLYDQNQYISIASVLCLIPENQLKNQFLEVAYVNCIPVQLAFPRLSIPSPPHTNTFFP